MSYSRYAVYYVPPNGQLASFGSVWLGWDIAKCQKTRLLVVLGVRDMTVTPRKYRFRGTLTPPFRLHETATAGLLDTAATELANARFWFRRDVQNMESKKELGGLPVPFSPTRPKTSPG